VVQIAVEQIFQLSVLLYCYLTITVQIKQPCEMSTFSPNGIVQGDA